MTFFVLYPLRSFKLGSGLLTGIFLVFYGVLRFFVEFLKDQQAISGSLTDGTLLGLGVGQWFSIPMAVVGVWLVIKALRRGVA